VIFFLLVLPKPAQGHLIPDDKRLVGPGKHQNTGRIVTTQTDKVEAYISSVSRLPPAPTLLTELLGLFRDPDRDIDRVVEIISLDPSLTVEILKRCNSAFLGGGNPASDMFEAVSRVGFYEIYCIVVAMFGSKTRTLPGVSDALDVSALWRHSVITAVAASTLSLKTDAPQGAAFTSGLLHDIGKLVIASVERQKYANVIKLTKTSGQTLVEAERAAFGLDHAQLGGRLLEIWHLPAEVFLAVQHHHDPTQADAEAQMAALIHVANWLAHGLEAGAAGGRPMTAVTGKAFVALGLKLADVPALNEASLKAMEKVKGLLEL
jgi:HD-like signal output (HDOD) protein